MLLISKIRKMKLLNKISLILILPASLWILNSCSEGAEAGFDDNTQFEQNPNNTSGDGGSLNQFTIAGPNQNYLYTVRNSTITVFDITNVNTPNKVNEFNAHQEIETVYDMGDKLFMGTPIGMLVYDIQTPEAPQYLGEFRHVRSCDPVVAEDDVAFVTLRGGGECGGTSNELHVLDISDPTNPQMMFNYDMAGPYGLGIDNGTLFVCDGEDGLKVYDASNPRNGIKQVAHFSKLKAIDVIPVDGLLIMIAEEGLYQYKYNGPESIELIISIKIGD